MRNLIEYTVNNEEASVTGFKGSAVEIAIPKSYIRDADNTSYTVTKVEKKAFLGVKGLKSITLPESIAEVGDWAFSKCSHLKEIRFNSQPIFGRTVFEGCERLEKIYVATKAIDNPSSAVNTDGMVISKLNEDIACLLASVVNKFEAGYLLRDDDIGTREWFKRWDLALNSYLTADDIDGYDDRALCGEEDISYDGIASVDGELLGDSGSYLNEVGKNKCFLCVLRMIHDSFLEEDMRLKLEKYIISRSFDSDRAFAWKMLKEDAGENLDFFEKYIEIVSPSKDSIEKMIKDISADKANIRSYLIKCSKNIKEGEDDFFSQLLL